MGALRTILHYITFGIVDGNEEVKRKNTPFKFQENFTFEDFKKVAIKIAKPIKRLYVFVENQYIIGEVKTVSGINSWKFKLDFNDNGTITGKYWFSYCDNIDSGIPNLYAEKLSLTIINLLEKNKN